MSVCVGGVNTGQGGECMFFHVTHHPFHFFFRVHWAMLAELCAISEQHNRDLVPVFLNFVVGL